MAEKRKKPLRLNVKRLLGLELPPEGELIVGIKARLAAALDMIETDKTARMYLSETFPARNFGIRLERARCRASYVVRCIRWVLCDR